MFVVEALFCRLFCDQNYAHTGVFFPRKYFIYYVSTRLRYFFCKIGMWEIARETGRFCAKKQPFCAFSAHFRAVSQIWAIKRFGGKRKSSQSQSLFEKTPFFYLRRSRQVLELCKLLLLLLGWLLLWGGEQFASPLLLSAL